MCRYIMLNQGIKGFMHANAFYGASNRGLAPLKMPAIVIFNFKYMNFKNKKKKRIFGTFYRGLGLTTMSIFVIRATGWTNLGGHPKV